MEGPPHQLCCNCGMGKGERAPSNLTNNTGKKREQRKQDQFCLPNSQTKVTCIQILLKFLSLLMTITRRYHTSLSLITGMEGDISIKYKIRVEYGDLEDTVFQPDLTPQKD